MKRINPDAIPKDVALRLCAQIRRQNLGKWYSLTACQCKGCIRWSRGDEDMRCFNSRPGGRGCDSINARYDKMIKNAS